MAKITVRIKGKETDLYSKKRPRSVVEESLTGDYWEVREPVTGVVTATGEEGRSVSAIILHLSKDKGDK